MIDPNDTGTLDLVAACEEPLSGAERARRHRLKKKQAGVKPISLTSTERCVLSLGLLAHEDLFHRPADWVTSKKPEFDTLLRKLWPEGDNGRYLAEPKRSTYRPAAFLRDQLAEARTETRRLKDALQQIAAEVGGGSAALPAVVSPAGKPLDAEGLSREIHFLTNELNKTIAEVDTLTARLQEGRHNGDFATLEVTDAPLLSVWEGLPTDFARARTALGLLRLRNAQHAELVRAVEILQARLRAAGLDDRVNDRKEQWYWNTLPHRDFRATSAPEYMERLGATPTTADELRDAQRYLANAQADIERLHEEQRKSFANNRVLIARLKAAGLPTDFSKQPGE